MKKAILRKVDTKNIFGMCYLALENENVFDVESGINLLKNLGVKSVRNWMHFESMLIDENTLNQTNYEKLKKYIKLQQDYDLLKSTSEKDISVLKQELDNTKADLADWKSKKEELDLAIGEIRGILDNL